MREHYRRMTRSIQEVAKVQHHTDADKPLSRLTKMASADNPTGALGTVRSKVFISYSHKDTQFLHELLDHLKPLERAGLVDKWSDQQIEPGSHWLDDIEDSLARAKVAVLLVTRNFLASDFIDEKELGPLLKSAESNGVIILWVPVRACSYQDTPLSKYQAVIPPDKPLAEMRAGRDKAWVKVCNAIKISVTQRNVENSAKPVQVSKPFDDEAQDGQTGSDPIGSGPDRRSNNQQMLYACLERIRRGVHPFTALQSEKVHEFDDNDDLVRLCDDLQLHGIENPCATLPIPRAHWLGFLKLAVGRDLGTNEGMLAALDDLQALPGRLEELTVKKPRSNVPVDAADLLDSVRDKPPLQVADVFESYSGQMVEASGSLANLNVIGESIIAVVCIERQSHAYNVGCQFIGSRWRDMLRDSKTGDLIQVIGTVSKNQSGQILHLVECEIKRLS